MARNHACNAVVASVGTMAMMAHVDWSLLNSRIEPTEANRLKVDHSVRRTSECKCATKIGMKACSETSFKTVTTCMISLCTKSAGTASIANTMETAGKYLCGTM